MGAGDPLEADHLLESLLNHHINLTVIDSWIRTLRAPRTVFVHNKNTFFFGGTKKVVKFSWDLLDRRVEEIHVTFFFQGTLGRKMEKIPN